MSCVSPLVTCILFYTQARAILALSHRFTKINTYLQRKIRNLQISKTGLNQHKSLVRREGAALDAQPLGEADALKQIVQRSLLGLADRAADLGAATAGVEQVLQASVKGQRAQNPDRLKGDHLCGVMRKA